MTSAQYIKYVSCQTRLQRNRLGMTITALSKSAKVGTGTISEIENGAGNVRISTLHKIATALNLRVSDLLP